jgi:hypothetical protein
MATGNRAGTIRVVAIPARSASMWAVKMVSIPERVCWAGQGLPGHQRLAVMVPVLIEHLGHVSQLSGRRLVQPGNHWIHDLKLQRAVFASILGLRGAAQRRHPVVPRCGRFNTAGICERCRGGDHDPARGIELCGDPVAGDAPASRRVASPCQNGRPGPIAPPRALASPSKSATVTVSAE